MNMHQAASFAPDTFVNGLSMLFIAYIIASLYETEKFNWWDYSVLLVSGVLLSPAKAVYFPIVFLILLVIRKWKEEGKGRAYILSASIIILSIVSYIVIIGERTVDIAGVNDVNWEGGSNYTFSFILSHPLQTAAIFLRTIYYNFEYFIYSAFGQYLCGNTLHLPHRLIQVVILLVMSGLFYGERNEWQPFVRDRIVFFSIIVTVVIFCLVSMFLGWTSDFRDIIIGVQGRYFIPVLPLGLLVFRSRKLLIPHVLYRNAAIIAFMLVQSYVILRIFNQTLNWFE